ncbi:hypothetical protein MOO46_06770 [Apilactobacillus apisilvae]|uniref:DUF1659 domain-containing protein n=1 Tax=Apilactobacillus apisilvae TaxID=2923364 RepID=A0ABY4PH00_9LACO|nr:hypothetical protein [Apilactobacillus apisilvae]UQS84940.1 hypothetical protein MOO46_06770 [Apilactobacillus apisilvae]
MNKTWDKTKVVYNMVTKDAEKVVKRSFTNIIENVTDDQIAEFGSILKTLTTDNLENVELVEQTKYYA